LSPAGFEATLAAIFNDCEQAVSDRLAKEKAKAENLQALGARRFAYTVAEAIEEEVGPAVAEALASYDGAINRPIVPNERWEVALKSRIGHAVDAGVRLGTGGHEDAPWKPLLAEEAPALKARLLALADAHFKQLGKAKRRGGPRRGWLPEPALRSALFVAGLVVGALVVHLLPR
jgi:hypothetical protein